MCGEHHVAAAGVDVQAVPRNTKVARQAVADGLIGYALLVAETAACSSREASGCASHGT